MKSQFSLTELAQQITDRAAKKEDFVADTRDIKVDPVTTVVNDRPTTHLALKMGADQAFSINTHAHGQIASHLDIPSRYYNRMLSEAPELLAENANHWLTNAPARRMVRTLDGRARAFLSDRYQRMDDDAFAEVVLPVVFDTPQHEVVSCGMDDEKTHIKFVSKALQRDVKVNDPVQFGIAFSNSEVGCGRIQGSLLIYRLVCLNGAISPEDAFGANHVGGRVGKGRDLGEIFKLDTLNMDAKATIMKLRDFAHAILSNKEIDRVVERMRGLAAMEIKKPVEAVERLGKTQGFSEGERESILGHLIKGGDLSLWGLTNAVTAAAQDDQLSYARATEFENIGGKILTLSSADYRELQLAA